MGFWLVGNMLEMTSNCLRKTAYLCLILVLPKKSLYSVGVDRTSRWNIPVLNMIFSTNIGDHGLKRGRGGRLIRAYQRKFPG